MSGSSGDMNAGGSTTEQGLAGRRVLLCVCGGIAAYKSVELVRRLRDAGADVQVAMTDAAQRFVTAQRFQAVFPRLARTTLWDAAAQDALGHPAQAPWEPGRAKRRDRVCLKVVIP